MQTHAESKPHPIWTLATNKENQISEGIQFELDLAAV